MRQTCQQCGRKVGHENLMESRDPWDGKWKWVCIDADDCAAVDSETPPLADGVSGLSSRQDVSPFLHG